MRGVFYLKKKKGKKERERKKIAKEKTRNNNNYTSRSIRLSLSQQQEKSCCFLSLFLDAFSSLISLREDTSLDAAPALVARGEDNRK